MQVTNLWSVWQLHQPPQTKPASHPAPGQTPWIQHEGRQAGQLVAWVRGQEKRERDLGRTTNENTSTDSMGVRPLSCTLLEGRENGTFSEPGVTSQIMAEPDRLQCVGKTQTRGHET